MAINFGTQKYVKACFHRLDDAIKDAGGRSTRWDAAATLASMAGHPDAMSMLAASASSPSDWDHLLSAEEAAARRRMQIDLLVGRHGVSEAAAASILDEVGPTRLLPPKDAPIAWEREADGALTVREGAYAYRVAAEERENAVEPFGVWRSEPAMPGHSMARGRWDWMGSGRTENEALMLAAGEIRDQRALGRVPFLCAGHPSFSSGVYTTDHDGYVPDRRWYRPGSRIHVSTKSVGLLCAGGCILYGGSLIVPADAIAAIPEFARPDANRVGEYLYGWKDKALQVALMPHLFSPVERGRAAQQTMADGMLEMLDGRLPATDANAFLVRHGLFDPMALFDASQSDPEPVDDRYFHVRVEIPPRTSEFSPFHALVEWDSPMQVTFAVPAADLAVPRFRLDPNRHAPVSWPMPRPEAARILAEELFGKEPYDDLVRKAVFRIWDLSDDALRALAERVGTFAKKELGRMRVKFLGFERYLKDAGPDESSGPLMR